EGRGDVGGDRFRGGAGVGAGDLDDGIVDDRKVVHREFEHRHDAEEDGADREQHGEDGAADEGVGEATAHRVASVAGAVSLASAVLCSVVAGLVSGVGAAGAGAASVTMDTGAPGPIASWPVWTTRSPAERPLVTTMRSWPSELWRWPMRMGRCSTVGA